MSLNLVPLILSTGCSRPGDPGDRQGRSPDNSGGELLPPRDMFINDREIVYQKPKGIIDRLRAWFKSRALNHEIDVARNRGNVEVLSSLLDEKLVLVEEPQLRVQIYEEQAQLWESELNRLSQLPETLMFEQEWKNFSRATLNAGEAWRRAYTASQAEGVDLSPERRSEHLRGALGSYGLHAQSQLRFEVEDQDPVVRAQSSYTRLLSWVEQLEFSQKHYYLAQIETRKAELSFRSGDVQVAQTRFSQARQNYLQAQVAGRGFLHADVASELVSLENWIELCESWMRDTAYDSRVVFAGVKGFPNVFQRHNDRFKMDREYELSGFEAEGRLKEIIALERALVSPHQLVEDLKRLVIVLERQGRFEEAERFQREIVAWGKGEWSSTSVGLNRSDWKPGFELNTRSLEALARLQSEQGDYLGAAQSYERVNQSIEAAGASVDIEVKLEYLLEEAEQWEKAGFHARAAARYNTVLSYDGYEEDAPELFLEAKEGVLRAVQSSFPNGLSVVGDLKDAVRSYFLERANHHLLVAISRAEEDIKDISIYDLDLARRKFAGLKLVGQAIGNHAFLATLNLREAKVLQAYRLQSSDQAAVVAQTYLEAGTQFSEAGFLDASGWANLKAARVLYGYPEYAQQVETISQQALEVFRQTGSIPGRLQVHELRARWFTMRGQYEESWREYRAMEVIYLEELNDPQQAKNIFFHAEDRYKETSFPGKDAYVSRATTKSTGLRLVRAPRSLFSLTRTGLEPAKWAKALDILSTVPYHAHLRIDDLRYMSTPEEVKGILFEGMDVAVLIDVEERINNLKGIRVLAPEVEAAFYVAMRWGLNEPGLSSGGPSLRGMSLDVVDRMVSAYREATLLHERVVAPSQRLQQPRLEGYERDAWSEVSKGLRGGRK